MAIKLIDSTRWQGRIFNGNWIEAKGGTHPVDEPATGKILYDVGQANTDDATAAIEQASSVQKAWAATPPRERSAILRRAAQILEEQIDEAADLVARESGGIEAKGRHEINEAITLFYRASSLPLLTEGQVYPTTQGRLSYGRRRPLGVVGVISPFNFPLVLGLRSVAPALALGNSVVLKPDPRTPFSGGNIIAVALEQAGLPKGVLQVFSGGGEVGQAIVEHPKVQMIAFTGSTGAGRKIGEAGGRHLKKLSLELGGKNPLIVLDDADLDKAASAVAFGAWFHQGQICMATGRVIVQKSIAEALTERLIAKAKQLKAGNPSAEAVALGPIIDQKQLQHIVDIVDDSVAAGACLEAGGTHEGLFYAPTVLSNVKPGMRCYTEEVFGPVINIVTFDTDDEAAQIANDTEYGLSSGILTGNVGRAMELGEKLHAGMLHINDQTVGDEVVNPFGGTGASGNGSSVSGPSDWDLYTHWQWITVDTEIREYPF